MLTRIAAVLGTLAVIFGLSIAPASAATASPGEWVLVGQSSVFNDGGQNAVRMKTPYYASTLTYGYTGAFQGVLTGSKSNANITVCATYRTNEAGWPVRPVISNGVWSVTLPATFSNLYQTHCASVFNGASQPFNAVSIIPSNDSSGQNLVFKNVTIN